MVGAPVTAGRVPVVTIVLNTNRKQDTLECLASLAGSVGPANHVIVLDNHSRDGSVEAIRASFPQTEIIAIETDRGYAGNNNVGVRAARAFEPEWVLILNEDTILAPDCLRELVAAGEADPRIGMVGPMVFHHDEPEVIQSAGGRLGPYWESIHLGANEADRGQFPQTRPVDWISGCALLVRQTLIDEIGMLDERFYYYWEETEWCLRARKAGWRVVHVPAAKLWHKGVRRDYKPSANVTYYSTRNRFLMMSKHRAPMAVQAVVWSQTLRTLASWSIRSKWREAMREHRNAMWRGLVDFLFARWGIRAR